MASRDESSSQPVLYACCAVEDLPVPYVASRRGRECAGCGREVWWDPDALAAAEAIARGEGGYIVYMCERCMERWSKAILEVG